MSAQFGERPPFVSTISGRLLLIVLRARPTGNADTTESSTTRYSDVRPDGPNCALIKTHLARSTLHGMLYRVNQETVFQFKRPFGDVDEGVSGSRFVSFRRLSSVASGSLEDTEQRKLGAQGCWSLAVSGSASQILRFLLFDVTQRLACFQPCFRVNGGVNRSLMKRVTLVFSTLLWPEEQCFII